MRNLEADGRFYELKATQQAYGPLGIVTTLSKEYSLDAMLDACESVITADVSTKRHGLDLCSKCIVQIF